MNATTWVYGEVAIETEVECMDVAVSQHNQMIETLQFAANVDRVRTVVEHDDGTMEVLVGTVRSDVQKAASAAACRFLDRLHKCGSYAGK